MESQAASPEKNHLPASSAPAPATAAGSAAAGQSPAAATAGWWVVCLCAEWCGTCREYTPLFNSLAQQHPEARFVWVDIEDEEDLAGELDIETFPTLLIADGRHARFFGPLLPQAAVLGRLLQSLASENTPDSGTAASKPGPVSAEAQALWERVLAARGGATAPFAT